MRLLTIGFTKKSAQNFFSLLQAAGTKRVIDVRLNNVSQLAGFSKRDDLAFFLDQLCHIDYSHLDNLAPTKDILDEYKKQGGSWERYERQFLTLMAERRIEEQLNPELLHDACLLCSEDQPHFCHRRLVAEYLQRNWDDVEIKHLG